MTVPLTELLARRNETTRLSPGQERVFRAWMRQQKIDPDDPRQAYDYRGAFLAQARPEVSAVDREPHWPDAFKQHGHPTFSVESKYSAGLGDGGTWGGMMGEQFTPPTGLLQQLAATLLKGKK